MLETCTKKETQSNDNQSHAICWTESTLFYPPASIRRAQLDRSYLYRFHVEFHAIARRLYRPHQSSTIIDTNWRATQMDRNRSGKRIIKNTIRHSFKLIRTLLQNEWCVQMTGFYSDGCWELCQTEPPNKVCRFETIFAVDTCIWTRNCQKRTFLLRR